MRCARCQDVTSAYIEGELSARVARKVGEHLAGCVDCRAAEVDLRHLCECLRDLGIAESPSLPASSPTFARPAIGAPDGLWARIEAGLDEEERRERSRGRALSAWMRRYPQLAPATAALVLGGGLAGSALVQSVRESQAASDTDRALVGQSRASLDRMASTERRILVEATQAANADRAHWSDPERQQRDERFEQLSAKVSSSIAAARDVERPEPASEERLRDDLGAAIAFCEEVLTPDTDDTVGSAERAGRNR